jgi:hypothetical protein
MLQPRQHAGYICHVSRNSSFKIFNQLYWALYATRYEQLSTAMLILFKGEGTPRKLATAISEKRERFQAGNWFPD